MNSKIILLFALAALNLAPAARAQLEIGLSAEIHLGRAAPPPPPEIVVVEDAGPPPWAADHRWYRRSYGYYYYPGCDVYYRPADRVWFYLDGGNWRFGASLPDRIRVDFGQAVSLRLETDRPYVYHQKVVAYYPANYFAKVKFRNGHDNRRDDPPGRGRSEDRDHRGKGHGPGRSR